MTKWQRRHKPFDWFCLHKCSICHHFHPWFHLFGCVSAKVVCPHVGMCCLFFFWRGEATKRKYNLKERKKDKEWAVENEDCGDNWKKIPYISVRKYTDNNTENSCEHLYHPHLSNRAYLYISAVNLLQCYRTYCEFCSGSKVALFARSAHPRVFTQKQKNRGFSQQTK